MYTYCIFIVDLTLAVSKGSDVRWMYTFYVHLMDF